MLDRKYLGSLVFNAPEKLELLNKLTHPATIADAERWMQQQTTPYAIKGSHLIFESGAQRHLDYVIGVTAPAHCASCVPCNAIGLPGKKCWPG